MTADAQITARSRRTAADWHAAWALAFGLAAAAWASGGDGLTAWALGAAAAPGLIGQVLRWVPRGRVTTGLAIAWPAGVGVAIVLSGGLAGPLAALALAPAAAMARSVAVRAGRAAAARA